ncbi:pseudouridine synthase [Brachyspira hampsonii]|uniref:pseudouridine synthase n=1 Tax=Brachyspira hampsonii TaxID=1287055 RepID=UPI0002AE5D80|nr:pseudouridine synthase [Brachyspira hampsonii]ELV05192.1 pseudouridine synthase [Brachyspira hampsonii 30599]
MKKQQNEEAVRLVKVILESGFASRRNCEKAIMSGRVRVNNQVILDPAYRVKEDDSVSIDRELIKRQTKRYMALYKPIGVVSTTKYLPGRRIITEFFKGIKERLFYAGRLDSESRGIMIITNDGEFANIITHPSYEILKVYDVTVNGKIDSEALLNASKGITIKNVSYSPFKFKILSKGRIQSKIRLTINEGKNREIRKIFDYLGYKVIDLERISVGCVSKYDEVSGTLEAGHIRDLNKKRNRFLL